MEGRKTVIDTQEAETVIYQKNLKIQGLLERLGQQAANYEDTIADLRVQLTQQEQELNQFRSQQGAQVAYEPFEKAPEVVPGEVVE